MAKRALIIATGAYDDPDLTPLQSPELDGKRLAGLLSRADVGGYEIEECYDADLMTARLAIHDFFAGGKCEDLNFVLISGHGIKDHRGTLYFAMRNTRRNALAATALEAHYVRERMRDSVVRQQILCVDTCYSGAFPNGMMPKAGLLTVTDADLGADGATGTAVITACNSATVAMERELAGRTQSVFTRHLIEGIESGAADTEGSGRILLDDLFLYVKNRVIAEIPNQTPKIVNGFDGPITIARNPNFRRVELPAALRKRIASKVRAQRGMAVEELHTLAVQNGRLAPLALEALRQLALEALRQLSRDDSEVVRRAAQESLEVLLRDEVPDAVTSPAWKRFAWLAGVVVAILLAVLIWTSLSRRSSVSPPLIPSHKNLAPTPDKNSGAIADGANAPQYVALVKSLEGRWYPEEIDASICQSTSAAVSSIKLTDDGTVILNKSPAIPVLTVAKTARDGRVQIGESWFYRDDKTRRLLINSDPTTNKGAWYRQCQ